MTDSARGAVKGGVTSIADRRLSGTGARFKVRRTQCATCIYRPGLEWDLDKLEREVADTNMAGHFSGWRACHHHRGDVCCAGFAARHGDRCTVIQIATRLGLVEKIDDAE